MDQLKSAQLARRSVNVRVGAWLLGSAVGAAILALPDSDDRIFSFSETHGPSPVDLAGIVVLLLAWLPMVALFWSYRSSLRGPTARLAASLVLAGGLLLVVAIAYDLGWVWFVPAVLLVVAQILAVAVIRRQM